ncbi:PLAC8 family protein [Zostera marina]|uniref:PLAC8 family protein n=1 Tax=Zostera marina TaxID=29655 RepID=A0A0K9PM44_ZOSMR|nr:PLAC8 family protein [Zostera marina]
MASTLGNGKMEEIQQEPVSSSGTTTSNTFIEEDMDKTPLHIKTSQVGKLDGTSKKMRFLGMLSFIQTIKNSFRSEILYSPSIRFRQFAVERDEFSRTIASPEHQERHHIPFVKKINWGSVLKMSKEWLKNPMNMVLFGWIACVAISGAILFMIMTGMLNHAIPSKSQRDTWYEVNNQILNALFTLMCLYNHPMRFYYLALLCRWNEEDIMKLRKVYCKNGTYKPHEWTHMMVVVFLLHVNCFAQYGLCALNLGYRRSDRPPLGVAICISIAIAAPAIAAIYGILSPLGKEYAFEQDQESQTPIRAAKSSPDSGSIISPIQSGRSKFKTLQKKYSFMSREDKRIPETRPQWIGGLMDLWDDLSLAYLSFFCGFCVFGWNMDRLGFGNMYVHIATFMLLCTAPFWIFTLAAVNINNEAVREALGLTGIILCIFGLFYGGFWRIQMRKKFNLPETKFCCRSPAATDCFQWLCCCVCSLAQEARTADFYDVVEDKFCSKEQIRISPTINEEEELEGDMVVNLSPPSPVVIERDHHS